MDASTAKGSDKLWERLFDKEPPSYDELNRAVETARANYKVVGWEIRGQPAIDYVRARINVPILGNAGKVVQEFLSLQSREINVNLEAFPFGMPDPEGIFLNVKLQRNLARK